MQRDNGTRNKNVLCNINIKTPNSNVSNTDHSGEDVFISFPTNRGRTCACTQAHCLSNIFEFFFVVVCARPFQLKLVHLSLAFYLFYLCCGGVALWYYYYLYHTWNTFSYVCRGCSHMPCHIVPTVRSNTQIHTHTHHNLLSLSFWTYFLHVQQCVRSFIKRNASKCTFDSFAPH